MVGRLLLRGQRISGVELRGIAVHLQVAVQLVGSGLGEDFDTAIAEAIVLRRERVLVDANLADGGLRRKLSAGEAVNVNLSAVGSGRRPGQRGELARQLVRIVGESLE